MKKILILSATLALAAGSALAANEKRSADFDRLDANNDGYITPREHNNYGNSHFSRVDTNDDGRISRAEFLKGKYIKGEYKDKESAKRDRRYDRQGRYDSSDDNYNEYGQGSYGHNRAYHDARLSPGGSGVRDIPPGGWNQPSKINIKDTKPGSY